jgi:hypothetical protein
MWEAFGGPKSLESKQGDCGFGGQGCWNLGWGSSPVILLDKLLQIFQEMSSHLNISSFLSQDRLGFLRGT